MLSRLKSVLRGVLAALIGCLAAVDLPDDDPANDRCHTGRPVRLASRAVATEAFTTVEFAVEQGHEFVGRHLLASYTQCDPRAVRDLDGIRRALRCAVQASGATCLEFAEHVFPPHGLTLVVLLSESHASIHTYPEHSACFVDLFTCGRKCNAERFDRVLRTYLRPGGVDVRVVLRDDGHPTDPPRA